MIVTVCMIFQEIMKLWAGAMVALAIGGFMVLATYTAHCTLHGASMIDDKAVKRKFIVSLFRIICISRMFELKGPLLACVVHNVPGVFT